MIAETVAPCPCAAMNGRKRDICKGHADLPLETVNAYRTRWGLAPLAELPHRSARIRDPKPQRTTGGCRGCGGGPRRQPSLIKRAADFAAATARHLADDLAPAPPDALQFRENACQGCPLRDGGTCSECGCSLYPTFLNQGKLRWRSETCPAGRWFRHNPTYRPLQNPTRNLIFHVYPLRGAEWNWYHHLDTIRDHASLFNGKMVVAIVEGLGLAPPSEVQSRLSGLPNVEWIIKRNSKQAETVTAVDLLRAVKTDDPNTITLRGHCKGVTHRRDGVEQPWAQLLWETCLDIDAVQDALASHIFAGPLKSHQPLVSRKPGDWFYAGSFFWFRSDIFQRDWTYTTPDRWFIEYFPSHVARSAEAACLCHDHTQTSVFDWEYWKTQVQPDWELWKAARP